ncbi:response regulator [Gynuella sunshinyii]|uniref:Transcriptional regulatory protein n=1 Tax=Gynuella sunshinyii YC6258 TaxID=1445510 RepID=A0A0C5VUE2_9GAMM|nr:response regulator [Gynuella sunshinyii]AJQ97756.1 response regulator of citrate/malate metabolism [Gynuella sunshinyii YC6258]
MSLIRTLVVEDDPQIAEIQRRFVNKVEGFDLIGIAHSLEDAKDLIDVMKPDLLMLDIYFPSGSGLDLLKQLRKDSLATDVILITAAKDIDTLKSALHGGVFDYILKPLVFERLKEALQRYARHHQQIHQIGSIDQNELDNLLNRGLSGHDQPTRLPDSLPKGIDSLTLEKVRDVFNNQQDLNAEDVGQLIGASRTTARRYLEHLVSSDELIADINYGAVGRPERRYRSKR